MFLTKHHGLGNDFLIALDEHERNGRALAVDGALARSVCDRRRGIGADGLIHGARPTAAQIADGIDVVMHLFNSDGSRAELSGNGARCLAQAVAMACGVDQGTITALTDAGVRPMAIVDAPDTPDATWVVSVEMGEAGSGPSVPPAVAERLGEARWGTVDMGNPHLVVLVSDPDAIDLGDDGPSIEKHFPEGINVEFIRATAAGDAGIPALDLRVWERGAGITEACGTGACAAAYQFGQWFPDDARRDVSVRMPGGEVTIRLDGARVTLIGPAAFIAGIDLDDPAVS